MSKIKYINCFGTSYTAGGGFEFVGMSDVRNNLLKKFYSGINEEHTQFNFSYPGQIQRLNSKIKVNNYAKSGYGNDRMMRLVYDIITSTDFDTNEHIFLLEFGGIGRKEFWFQPINDFIVMNYWVDWDTETLKNRVDLANSYCYDSIDMQNTLKNEEPLFLEYYTKTFNLKNEIKKYWQDIDFFIAYLNSKNINYFVINADETTHKENCFTYGDGIIFKQSNDFTKFTSYNKLEIDIETNYAYNDKHNGYVSNKIVGQTIYNELIDRGYLKFDKIDIDYIGLRNLKLLNTNII